jgi:hypothetical protein
MQSYPKVTTLKKALIGYLIYGTLLIYGHTQHIKKEQPASVQVVYAQTEQIDSRIETLESFLEKYNSPMASEAESFIKASDDNGLDWRLLPAIAGVESTFGKFTPSCAEYNSFGWTSTTSPCGFYRFESYREAIYLVAQKIGNGSQYAKYRSSRTIRDLSSTYNNSEQKWVHDIGFFMSKLDEAYRQKGQGVDSGSSRAN